MSGHFTPAAFRFLRELEANNDKQWWEENKARYLKVIREPALNFIVDFGERLKAVSPHFVADARTNGGSLLRPYRDMRFATNDEPYRTNVGIRFPHELGNHAPGFYLHIEPGQTYAGSGLWRPETPVARRIRQAIDDNPSLWRTAAHSTSFTDRWKLAAHEGDRLKRIPADFDDDHPFPDDLRLRNFTAETRLSQRIVTSPGFADELLELFRMAGPYTHFLCDAVGVPF